MTYPTPNLDYAYDVLQRHMISRQESVPKKIVITSALANHEKQIVNVTWYEAPKRTKIHHAVITFAQWDYHQRGILSNQ